MEQLLKRPESHIGQFREVLANGGHLLSDEEAAIVEIQIKYEGYIRQQAQEVHRMEGVQQRRIPDGFDFSIIPGLSREVVEKLNRARPASLGMASKISGITPAAVSIINVHLELDKRRRAAAG
jgi:tRNA uridine 5-carboxymethylaminomethyl modification enzyme